MGPCGIEKEKQAAPKSKLSQESGHGQPPDKETVLHRRELVACELCQSCFNLGRRHPLQLCSNKHRACQVCVNNFHMQKIKHCPFCDRGLRITPDDDFIRVLEAQDKFDERHGLLNSTIVTSGKTLLDLTLQEAKRHHYKDVLDKLVDLEANPVEKITSIHEKLNNVSTPIDLTFFTNLETLEVAYSELTSIGYFGTLPNLRRLNLGSNKIRKINSPQGYYRLESLDLEFNQIEKIENLSIFSSLKELSLEYNQISRIENLDQLRHLQILKLNRNKIAAIENLQGLTELQVLHLQYNLISAIGGLDDVPGLHELNLGNNLILKIEHLHNLKELERLSLESNKIEVVENLTDLPRLKYLNIKDNPTYKRPNSVAITTLKNKFHVEILIV